MIQSLTITHADSCPFAGDGLRAFFVVAQLGIGGAVGGADVIRAAPAGFATAPEDAPA